MEKSPKMMNVTVQSNRVNAKRRGFAFNPETPIFTAWRTGNLERTNFRSSSPYSLVGIFSSSVAKKSSSPLETSDTTFPSFNSTIRSAYVSANSRSWETTSTSFSLESFLRVSKICLPVSESNAPVGSSAMMISGDLISARAMAIRCF